MLLTGVNDHEIPGVEAQSVSIAIDNGAAPADAEEQLLSIMSMPVRPGTLPERHPVESHGKSVCLIQKPLCRSGHREVVRTRITVRAFVSPDPLHDPGAGGASPPAVLDADSPVKKMELKTVRKVPNGCPRHWGWKAMSTT